MSNDCKPCVNPHKEGEYLLVKSTGIGASVCGDGEGGAATSDCQKQEPTFDNNINSFLVPVEGEDTAIQVCNPNVYTVGTWLYFVNYGLYLRVVNIIDNILTLQNKCEVGTNAPVNNPDSGLVIPAGAAFVVAGAPDCASLAKYTEIVTESISDMTEIEAENLLTSGANAVVHPVGRIQSDPDDLSVTRSIKRIFGILFKAGRPFLSALGSPLSVTQAAHRPLTRRNSDGAIFMMRRYHEESSLENGRQYLLVIAKGQERLRGPTYIPRFFSQMVEENTSSNNPSSWPDFTDSFQKTFDLSAIPQINNIDSFDGRFYVWLNIEFAVHRTGAGSGIASVLVDSRTIAKVSVRQNEEQFNSSTVPVRVDKSSNEIKFRVNCSGAHKLYYRVEVYGVFQ